MGAGRERIAAHLLVILSVSVLQACSANRDPSLTSLTLPGIVGVWNRSNATWDLQYPATKFRNDSVVGYFDVWPENTTDFKFIYYCDDPTYGNLSLINFTYGPKEGHLNPRPYFDLGIVELYQPYWRHWLFWKVDTKRIVYPINCEYSDLHELYSHRFWKRIMRNGFAAAAVMQGIIQVIVAVIVLTLWFRKFNRPVRREYLKPWFLNLHWRDFLSEVVHLGLLVLAGYSMMEAIGHSSLLSWRSVAMYNAGVIYSYLSLFAVLSSIFRQIAYCWMDQSMHEEFEKQKTRNALTIQGEVWYSLRDISDDWRWQRVFGQLGVVVLMGTYLTFADDESKNSMDQLASLVFAAVVVACIWSFGVSAVVSFRSIAHILTQTFFKAPINMKSMKFRVSDDKGGKSFKGVTLDLENGPHKA